MQNDQNTYQKSFLRVLAERESSATESFFTSGAKPPNRPQNCPVSASDPRVPSSALYIRQSKKSGNLI
jgi:hypothetical protein